jgi:tRNA dimethylallyltransferase
MHPSHFTDAFILSGPTASGKTAASLLIAERLGAEIISMDSMALYRGMDIGTAKPTVTERQRVPHHLVDVLEPWENATLAWWLERAATACEEIRRRGRRILIVGGTPLYLKGLLHGIFEGPPRDPELRQQLEALPGPELHARLQHCDPAAAARLHPNDARRLVRALEVFQLTGKPISDWQQQFQHRHPRPLPPLCLQPPRELLYQRINNRVLEMMDQGLLAEVQRLSALPHPLSREAQQAVGYAELRAYLDGKTSLAEAVERIQIRSRQFAKHQLTWFRHLPELTPVPLTGSEKAAEIVEKVWEVWQPLV